MGRCVGGGGGGGVLEGGGQEGRCESCELCWLKGF